MLFLSVNSFRWAWGMALPGETHGWNFVNNSADTRISVDELAQLQPLFRSSFVTYRTDFGIENLHSMTRSHRSAQ